MNERLNGFCLAATLLGVLYTPVSAAQDAYALARLTVDRAQRWIQAERFGDADGLLGDIECSDDVNCETLRQFSRGFLYETWAGADRDKRELLLGNAVEFYREARELSPDNAQILTNLALAGRSAGDVATAIDAAAQLVELDSANRYEHLLFFGDLQLANDQRSKALDTYQSAIELNEARPEAHRRILNLRIGMDDGSDVFEYSRTLSRDFPEIAIAGFLSVIKREFGRADGRSEDALIWWAGLRADLGQIGAADLDTMPGPEAWDSGGIAELHQLISGGQLALGWWSETNQRRDAIARVLRRRAATLRATDHMEREERQRAALALFSRAVNIAPSYFAYLDEPLEGRSNAQLDAATDLISLHHEIKAGGNYSELSGVSEGQLEKMTDVLFSGKAGAYAAGQREAIQRYHTVLGMVYYETGRLESDWADNATFQLNHALKTADLIAAEDPSRYKPLPELERMLAEVYIRQGKAEEGAARSLRAAMGFLETDNLPAAAVALDSVRDTGVDSPEIHAVATILSTRGLIRAEGMQAAEVEGQTITLKPQLKWLVKQGTLALNEDFIARQRFKALADLGSKLEAAGHQDISRTVNSQALDAASSQKTLTSLQDIRRIKSIESSLSARSFPLSAVPSPTITRNLEDRGDVKVQPAWSLRSGAASISIEANSKITEAAGQLQEQGRNGAVLRVESEAQRH